MLGYVCACWRVGGMSLLVVILASLAAVFLVISADSVMLAADDACQVEEVGSRVLCLHLPAP